MAKLIHWSPTAVAPREPTVAPISIGTVASSVSRQGIAPACWKRQVAVARPATAAKRLVPLATPGSRPMAIMEGR